MTEMSSSVAIAVPGVTSEPGLTRLRPRIPSKGAVITRSESWARTTSMRAFAASRVERCVSSWLSEMIFDCASSCPRASCRSAS